MQKQTKAWQWKCAKKMLFRQLMQNEGRWKGWSRQWMKSPHFSTKDDRDWNSQPRGAEWRGLATKRKTPDPYWSPRYLRQGTRNIYCSIYLMRGNANRVAWGRWERHRGDHNQREEEEEKNNGKRKRKKETWTVSGFSSFCQPKGTKMTPSAEEL